MMASQKVRSTALQQFFETSTYNMYAFTLEKLLRLVVRNFCLAILFFLRVYHCVYSRRYLTGCLKTSRAIHYSGTDRCSEATK